MKTIKRLILLLGMLLVSMHIFSQIMPQPVAKIFQLQTEQKKQNLLLSFVIEPGYQLYKKSIVIVNQNGKSLSPESWPKPAYHQYADLGKLAVYQHHLSLTIKLNPNSQYVIVHFQGCALAGFCYPPKERKIVIDQQAISGSNSIPSFWHLGMFLIYGLLIAFTPCVLPMIPIISAIIAGQKQLTPLKGITLSVSYVIGMACSYAAIGLVFALLGKNLQLALQHPWAIIMMSILFVLMALALFDVYQLQRPSAWQQPFKHRSKPSGIASVFIMGFVSTLILSPCVTPALVGALALISQSGHITQGILALFLMGIGIGIPLLIISAFGGHFLPKCGVWMCHIKQGLGFVMLAVALWNLSKILPETVMLWGYVAFIIATGIWLCWIFRRKRTLLILSILLSLGLSVYLINPQSSMHYSTPEAKQAKPMSFILVSNVKQLQELTKVALAKNKPVIIDYSANWCIACHEMQYQTFTDPAIKQFFKPWQRLQVDLSANDATAHALMDKHGIIAPPSLVFIKKEAGRIKTRTMVGKQSTRSLLQAGRNWKK